MRRINDLIKTKLQGKGSKVVHPEVLNVLLSLRIKEVDLRKEKDEETAPAKKFSYEQRRKLSKNQRKVCSHITSQHFTIFALVQL